MRSGDVNGVHAGIVDEGFVAGVAAGDVELAGEGIGGGLGAGTDGDERGVRQGGEALGEFAGDGAGAQDSPVDFVGHNSHAGRIDPAAVSRGRFYFARREKGGTFTAETRRTKRGHTRWI